MRMMHTKTTDFIQKMHNATTKGNPAMTINIRGMEAVRSGKWSSVKTGQIEEQVQKLAETPDVEGLEMVIMNECPEVTKVLLVKALDRDGNVTKIVRFPGVHVFEPLEEIEYDGCDNITTHTTY